MKLEGSFKGKYAVCFLWGVKLSLPTVFQLSTDGTVANLMDRDHLKVNVDLQACTYNLGMVTADA